MVDDDFTKRVGINMDTFFKKCDMIEIETDSKTVNFFPCKKKGNENIYFFLQLFLNIFGFF